MSGFVKTPTEREVEMLKNRLDKLEKRVDCLLAAGIASDSEIPERGSGNLELWCAPSGVVARFGDYSTYITYADVATARQAWQQSDAITQSLGSSVPPGSESALREGYYWVWYQDLWRVAEWDGEDWDILGWGVTCPRSYVQLGPRIVDPPTSGPPTPDLAAQPDSITPPNYSDFKKDPDSLASSVPPGSDVNEKLVPIWIRDYVKWKIDQKLGDKPPLPSHASSEIPERSGWIWFNVNDNVRLTLTDAGRDALIRHWKFSHPAPGEAERACDTCHKGWRNGPTVMNMWTAMQIFGPDTYMGGPNLFELNIEIEAPPNSRRMLEQGLIEELADSPDPSSSDERRRYYRLSRFGKRVAAAEVERLNTLLQQARETGLVPGA